MWKESEEQSWKISLHARIEESSNTTFCNGKKKPRCVGSINPGFAWRLGFAGKLNCAIELGGNTASFRVEWPLGVCLEHWGWVILGLCWDDLRKTKEKSCHGIEVSAHGTDGTHAINVWRGRIPYSDLGGPLPCLTHPHCWSGCAQGLTVGG